MPDRLWAGWRMAYIKGSGSAKTEECLFCGLAKQEPSSQNLVLERYEHSFLVLNAFPYTTGHVMVARYEHDDDLLGGGPEARSEVLAALARARRALSREYEAQGFNVGANLGRVAGAGVLGHLHWHAVPRWKGDTNFIPVIADTRVLPEALTDTYARLLDALETETSDGVTVTGRGRVS